jgi:hypothetical protein
MELDISKEIKLQIWEEMMGFRVRSGAGRKVEMQINHVSAVWKVKFAGFRDDVARGMEGEGIVQSAEMNR